MKITKSKLKEMIQEELEHQGMARRVGLITKLHKLIKEDSNDN